jgi:predicted TIM-barrel fold metal-dependent hydrolase
VIIDVNAYLGYWPFRHAFWQEPSALVRKLRSLKITEAWVGSFAGPFQADLEGVNARLAEQCQLHGEQMLVPFGSINPLLPDWEEDLRRCQEKHRMPGIRLHPNYHDYRLDHPAFARLLKLAAERKLIVQLSMRMEDERNQLKRFAVPVVDPRPLPPLLAALPRLVLVLLNYKIYSGNEEPILLARSGAVFFDISGFEEVGVVGRQAQRVGAERLLLGTHAGLFYPEAALLKIREAGLKKEEELAILGGNARRLLPATPRKEVP